MIRITQHLLNLIFLMGLLASTENKTIQENTLIFFLSLSGCKLSRMPWELPGTGLPPNVPPKLLSEVPRQYCLMHISWSYFADVKNLPLQQMEDNMTMSQFEPKDQF